MKSVSIQFQICPVALALADLTTTSPDRKKECHAATARVTRLENRTPQPLPQQDTKVMEQALTHVQHLYFNKIKLTGT